VLRVLVRLRKTLVDQRTAFKQRLHAVLFHHGLPCPDHALLTQATRGWLQRVALPQASRLQVTTALRQIDQLEVELDPLERWLRAFARRQPGGRTGRSINRTKRTTPRGRTTPPEGPNAFRLASTTAAVPGRPMIGRGLGEGARVVTTRR
jgi:transposase